MQRKIVFGIGIFIVLTLLFAQAGFSGDVISSSELVKEPVYGRAYTPECLSECHLVMKVSFGNLADMSKSASDSYASKYTSAGGMKADSCILESHYDIVVDETEQVWKPDVKCSDVWDSKNATNYKTCTDNGKYEIVKTGGQVWKPLKDFKPTEKGKYYYIDLVAKRNFKGYCGSIDAVPVMQNEELKQYAWWNNSWTYYKNITLTSAVSMLNNTVPVNVSYDGNMTGNFGDLRFVNTDGSELSYWIETNTTTYADVWIRIPLIEGGVNKTISMYYGNPAAPEGSDGYGTWLYFDDFKNDAVGSNPADWSVIEGAGYNVEVVSNVTKFGSRAVMLTNAGASQSIMEYTGLTFPKVFRYKSFSYLASSVNTAIYDHLKEVTTGLGWIATLYTKPAATQWQYYSGGWVVLGGAWTTGTWYSNQIIGDANSDTANYTTFDGSTANQKSIRTVITVSINKIYYAGPDGVAGTVYLGAVMVGNYSGPVPTYEFGSAQALPTTSIYINSNTTNGWTFKNGDFFSTNITAINGTQTGNVSEVYIEFNGANHSATKFNGNGIWNWNTTLAGVPGGNYAIKQYARNGTSGWETNASTYFTVNIVAGLNLSAFNMGNGTAISSWNVYITNGTAASDYIGTGKTNPTFLVSSAIPQGTVSITFYNGIFKNSTAYSMAVNSTGYYALNGYMSRYQQFAAKDKDTAAAINSFSLTAANSTFTYSGSTATGTLKVGLDELPIGTITLMTQASGYVPNTTTITINGNSEINMTDALQPAGVAFQAFSESTSAGIPFNITISNSTASWQITASPTSLYIYYTNSSLPKGDTTLAVSSANYGGRTYYLNINDHTFTNLSFWLLPTSSGSYVRFHTITSTFSGIPGVLVSANRTISGSNILAGQQVSDGSGTALLFLDPTATYTISAVKAGYNTYIGSVMPSSSDYNIQMNPLGSNITINTTFSDITYTLTPNGGALDNTTTTFNFSIASSNNSLCNYGMTVWVNGTLIYNGTGASPAGGYLNITYNLSSYGGTNATVLIWFTKCGFPTYSFTQTYPIYSVSAGPSSLINVLNTLKAGICPASTDKNGILWCLPLNFIALLVSALAGGAGSLKYSVNGGGAAFLATLWLFEIIGFFPFAITLILSLLVIAIIAWRSGL